jgi:hypothetical protein
MSESNRTALGLSEHSRQRSTGEGAAQAGLCRHSDCKRLGANKKFQGIGS